tara:strand:+ start:787 stop:1482 length:696 start_codon:yes stop_codon:yes gene_type:complete
MSQTDWEDCFLLHQRSYGETSIIAEVFCRNIGKISIIARGAKNPKSKFFGYLVPFHKLKITFSGRSELKTLINIERQFTNSQSSLSKTSYSLLYINELLIKLLPKNASQEELFKLYESFLEKVFMKENLELTLRKFELDLLDLLGYGLDYDRDTELNELIDKNSFYSYVPAKGFKKSSRHELKGEDIINIRDRNLKLVEKNILKKITNKAISVCMDGDNLKSRKIFKRLSS